MKLRSLLLLLFFTVSIASQAIEPVAQLFVSMPDSLLPSIEVNRRKDMIDLKHAGQKAQTATKLGGNAEMALLQDSLLSIDLSSQSKMAMRLYQTHRDDTLIVLINTVYAPAGDSRVRVFNSAWDELPASKYIRPIAKEEFFIFPDSLSKEKRKELIRPIDIYLSTYTFETDGSLKVQQSWSDYLDKESYQQIRPYLKETIELHWNGKKFE